MRIAENKKRCFEMNSLKEKAEEIGKKRKGAFLPIFLCWFAYMSAYAGRYSYPASIVAIEEAFSVTHSQSGLVTTCFFFAYGIGQVVNGILCKRYNRHLIIALVLFVSSAINFSIFLGIPFVYLKYIWLLNGVFQSMLWSSIILTLSENLESENLTKAVIAMSFSIATGTLSVYGFSSLMSLVGDYTYTFLFSAALMAAAALCWTFGYKKAYREASKKETVNKSVQTRQKADASLVVVIVMLATLAIANNLVKDGITTWLPSILKEQFGLPQALSIVLALVLPIMGMFGAVCNVNMRKRISSFLSISGIWYFIASAGLALVILFLKLNVWYLALLFFALIALSMHGANNLITGIVPLYMRTKINSGLLAGLMDGFCYVGSTISSYGLGLIADNFGWNGVLVLLLCVCVFSVAVSFLGRHNKSAN